jgi:hypothetical protein
LLGLGVEQPAGRTTDAIGLRACFSAVDCSSTASRPVILRRTGEDASEVGADRTYSFAIGSICDAFLGENPCNLLRRTGVLGRIVDARQQRKRNRMLRSRR